MRPTVAPSLFQPKKPHIGILGNLYFPPSNTVIVSYSNVIQNTLANPLAIRKQALFTGTGGPDLLVIVYGVSCVTARHDRAGSRPNH